MSDGWSKKAVDYVQAIADTKLMLSHWYAEQGFLGPGIQDNVALFSLTQDEYGQVRQFFRLLDAQGRDEEWLRSERTVTDFHNAATTDRAAENWTQFEVRYGLSDRAAYLMLDSLAHDDFSGLTEKMSEEEYSHFDFHDGWLEHLASAESEAFQEALEQTLPNVLAFIGPAAYDDTVDPLLQSGFTDRSVAELRESFLEYLTDRTEATDVTVPDPDPIPVETWNEKRRRVVDQAIKPDVLNSIRGTRNTEYAMR